MPERRTVERAQRDKAQGKAASTQAGEFIREEMDHIREGKHGARSSKQAIAIGLSKARRAGVELKPPAAGKASPKTRKSAERDFAVGHGAPLKRGGSARRSAATLHALQRENHHSATPAALGRQAHRAAGRRSAADRSAAARKAASTRSRND
jgi:hypothetical protein